MRALLFAACVAAGAPRTAGQEPLKERELIARARIFTEVGSGVAGLKATSNGDARLYYMLLPRAAEGGRVMVYRADGKLAAEVPAPIPVTPGGSAAGGAAPASGLVYAQDFDVDPAGRIYLADRGGNAVRIFSLEGLLLRSVPVAAPTSVVALSGGEFAVSSLRSQKLVTVYNAEGKVARQFSEPVQVSQPERSRELDRFLNIGRLAGDPASNIYYAFTYLPEPTVRKYDRWGYSQAEIELATLEFQPAAQATRRAIERLRESRFIISEKTLPVLKPTITALGVDPESEEVWVALGAQLLHFDRGGERKGTYRLYGPDSSRLEASAILIEPDRMLIASDALGIFEFPRPDKLRR